MMTALIICLLATIVALLVVVWILSGANELLQEVRDVLREEAERAKRDHKIKEEEKRRMSDYL